MLDTPEHIAELVRKTPLLLLLDIDGTLCDIVPIPEDARVPEPARDVVQRLAQRDGVHVALVTGRSVRDAQRIVQLRGVTIHGNHGIEISHADGDIEIDAAWSAAAPSLQSAATDLAGVVRSFPGSSLEHKDYTLTVHYRNIDKTRTGELVNAVAAVAERHSVRVESGKCILNVVPKIAVNKGTAVMRLVNDVFGSEIDGELHGSVLFVGDDVTDEHAFRALADVPGAVTAKVGDDGTPTAAKYRLADPDAVHRLLGLIEVRRA